MLFNIIATSVGVVLGMVLMLISVRLVAATRSSKRTARGLFRFHDGARTREVDPIAVYVALESDERFRLDLHPRRAIDDGDAEALEILASAVRAAFKVPEYSGPQKPGLTHHECAELLSAFMFYLDLQKKSSKSLQTSPQPTASTSPA